VIRTLKRLLVIALVVLVIAIPVNDFARFLMTFYSLDTVTRAAAQAAADQAKRQASRDVAGAAAVRYAQANGVHVYGYDQTQSNVTVWTDAPVPGTLAWGAIVAAMARKPFGEWWKTPPTIQGKAEALLL
jgi:hypothetical protein